MLSTVIFSLYHPPRTIKAARAPCNKFYQSLQVDSLYGFTRLRIPRLLDISPSFSPVEIHLLYFHKSTLSKDFKRIVHVNMPTHFTLTTGVAKIR